MINVKSSGNFRNTEKLFNNVKQLKYIDIMHKYGQIGMEHLRNSTPRDTGATANSWYYEIHQNGSIPSLVWYNSNETSFGVPVAILLQYGHATRSGGYVQGLDFINPALQPVFDGLARALWKEVTKV